MDHGPWAAQRWRQFSCPPRCLSRLRLCAAPKREEHSSPAAADLHPSPCRSRPDAAPLAAADAAPAADVDVQPFSASRSAMGMLTLSTHRCKGGCRHSVLSLFCCKWVCRGPRFPLVFATANLVVGTACRLLVTASGHALDIILLDWFEVWYVAGGERHGLGLNP